MGDWIELKARRRLRTRRLARRPRRRAARRHRRHPGDFRRQRPHPRGRPTASPPRAISRSRRRCSIAPKGLRSRIRPGAMSARHGDGAEDRCARTTLRDIAAAVGRPRAAARSASSAIASAARSPGPRRRRALRASPRRSAITAAASSALKDMKPKVPTMLHFGEKDDHIPVAGVREVEALHPDVAGLPLPRRSTASIATTGGATTRRARRSPGAGRSISSASIWADRIKAAAS